MKAIKQVDCKYCETEYEHANHVARDRIGRAPSGKPPRMYVKAGETYSAARLRWLPRWLDWRDLCVMAELNYQDSFASVTVKHKQFRKAFWGVEGKYIVEVDYVRQ